MAAATAAQAQASSVHSQAVQFVAAVQSLAVRCGDRCLSPGAHPFTQHDWSPFRASPWPRCLRFFKCWGRLRCTTPLAMRFTRLCWWDAISCSSVSTAISEWTSAAVSMFGGARVFVWRICKAARMLQESTCQRHASCPLSVLCFAARCECHLRAHQLHVPTYRARTSARVRSTRPSLPMQCAFQLSS